MAIRHAPPRRIPTNEQALRQFRFLYTTRDAQMPSGIPTRRTRTVCGLNQLDAEVRLSQLSRKEGQQVHVILNVVAVAKGIRADRTKVEYA